MKPTMEILTKLQENSKKHPDEVFTRLFRYLFRPDIYFVSYQHLYSNKGAGTKGVTEDTADGFSEEYIERIIESLKAGTYQPKPVRRTHIKKSNGKMRPLGLPTFTDKLIQENIRMILEAIYEPRFSYYSHGFRPDKSCHTALKQVKKEFTGARWFIEGDIKGCFDNINHTVLLNIIGKKIKDQRFLNLIRSFLKAGYMEDWKYYQTYSGCPQGSIISPILANIYLNELDKYVMKFKKEFDCPTKESYTPEYRKVVHRRSNLHQKIKKQDGELREKLITEYKKATKYMLQLPAKLCEDKKIKYVRYADDFLIAVNGNKQDCERIKECLTNFINEELKMELSQEKTLITHSNTPARFLGYDVRVRRNQQIKRKGRFKVRSLNNKVELAIPFADKIEPFLFSRSIVEQRKDNGKLEPCKRPSLLQLTDLEIVSSYNAELRGICNYYSLASNFYKLNYFNYLMEYSCLKTLADKYRSKISKIRKKYKDGEGNWGIPYETKRGQKRMYFAKYSDCKSKKCSDNIPQQGRNHAHTTTTFEKRLKAKICEVCGSTNSKKYEIHHVNKVKNLKGKAKWEQIMIAKRRKTLVVCHDCHMAIHHGEKKKKKPVVE